MNDLGRSQTAVVQMKPKAGLDAMKPLRTGRTRVDKQHSPQFFVAFNLKYMTVAAHKHVRRRLRELVPDAPIIASRPTAYVSHPKRKSIHLKTLVLRQPPAHFSSVDVSVNGT